MHKKIEVYVDGQYKFSSNRYRTCKEFLQFLKSKAFVFYQGINGQILVPLYNRKIVCHYAE